MNPLSLSAILLIRAYQATLSRLLKRRGVQCLHHPSCVSAT
jgi:putative component of membrane protein insertase Oxa1/YidC/SpoIIIJ protein YidD